VVGRLTQDAWAAEPQSGSTGVAGQSAGNRKQPQPQAFGFPAQCRMLVEGEHISSVPSREIVSWT
jgi:hypothetical protein